LLGIGGDTRNTSSASALAWNDCAPEREKAGEPDDAGRDEETRALLGRSRSNCKPDSQDWIIAEKAAEGTFACRLSPEPDPHRWEPENSPSRCLAKVIRHITDARLEIQSAPGKVRLVLFPPFVDKETGFTSSPAEARRMGAVILHLAEAAEDAGARQS
jgi:hypothetical protein